MFRRRPKIVNIYLMHLSETDIYKIGYTSKHPLIRMRNIKHYFPTISLIDFIYAEHKIESFLHILFNDKRISINGFTEYFRLNEDDLSIISNFFMSLRNIKHG